VAARAPLGEDDLAALDDRRGVGEIRRAVRRVLETVRITAGEEIPRHVRRLHLGRAPVDRVLRCGRDRNRRNRLAAQERAEVEQPLLAEHTDVEIDAVQRAEGPH
jgi:hypothetical protein